MVPYRHHRWSRGAILTLVLGSVLYAGCRQSPPTTMEARRDSVPPGPVHIGPNILVSGDFPRWDHTEYMGDADPSDSSKVMVCSMLYSQDQAQLMSGIYASFDGGKTWKLTLADSTSRFNGVWDPACAYGVNGDAYFATLSSYEDRMRETKGLGDYETWNTPNPSSYMPFYRSADGGRTWDSLVAAGWMDNQDITVDRTAGPYRGRVYVYGNTPPWSRVWLVYSTDGGKTFTQSAATKLQGYTARSAGPGTILPDGALILPYEIERGPRAPAGEARETLAVAVSRDGGETIEVPVDVTSYRGCYGVMKRPGVFDPARAPGMHPTVMAADHSTSPVRGRAYLAWGALYRDQCALFVAHSDDGGKKWSAGVRVSDAPQRAAGGPDMFLHQLVVNRDGVVGATWYDRREDPKNRNHRLRFSASLDGGDTWLPSVPVAEHEFRFLDSPEWRAVASPLGGGRRRSREKTDEFEIGIFPGPRMHEAWNNGMGDYAAIAATADGRFHAFWIDNRTGVAQLYTAAVTVDGTVTKHGSAALDSLTNVTSSLEIQYTSTVYNPTDRTVNLEYQLLNTSRDTIQGPLMLRVVKLSSDLGEPRIIPADESRSAAGTVIDLSSAVPANGLAPGATTPRQRMRLSIGPGDVIINPAGNTDIARMTARVYGRLR